MGLTDALGGKAQKTKVAKKEQFAKDSNLVKEVDKDLVASLEKDAEGLDKEGNDLEGLDKEGTDSEGQLDGSAEGTDNEGDDNEGTDNEGDDNEGDDNEGDDNEGDDNEGDKEPKDFTSEDSNALKTMLKSRRGGVVLPTNNVSAAIAARKNAMNPANGKISLAHEISLRKRGLSTTREVKRRRNF